MVDISVIVPAYNAEKYIKTCLDSILCQTKKEFEIVAVNDGSADGTLDILNQYKEKHPNIFKVISQENQGLSVTRNNGIKEASGKYILFVDSDDYIKPNMLEMLYAKAIEGDYDVVASDVDCIYPDKIVTVSSGIEFESVEMSVEEKKSMLMSMYVVVVNKLYKKELFNEELMFEPGIWFEDILFSHKLIPNIKSIAYVKEAFYGYVQNPSSITYTYSEKLTDINVVVNKVVEYYKNKGIYDVYKNELEYMYARYMLATYIKRLSKAKDLNRFKEGIKFAKQSVKNAFPDYRKNPYINSGAKGLYLKCFNSLFAYLIYIAESNKMN